MSHVLLVLLLVLASSLSAAAGTITGRVVFRGEIPALAPIRVTKDQQVCGAQVPSEGLLGDLEAEVRGLVWSSGEVPVQDLHQLRPS
ncbi:MAG: hypothetical protein ACE5MG_14735 [Candidatus Methylomirabilales bacterium]